MPKKLIVIPIHSPKVNWLISFNNSLFPANSHCSDYDFQILIVATDYGEYRFFSKLKSAGLIHRDITILCFIEYLADGLGFSNSIDAIRNNESRGIINSKKMAGLHWAYKNSYEVITCIDADCIAFSSPEGLFETISCNYDRALYFGSPTKDKLFIDIMRETADVFPGPERDHIRQTVLDPALYHWFFDVPSYKKSDLAEFFSFMEVAWGSIEAFFLKLNWHTFDHMLFSYWRCVFKGARIIDCSPFGAPIPEQHNFYHLVRIREKYSYSPAWLRCAEVFHQPDMLSELPKAILGYHLDRS